METGISIGGSPVSVGERVVYPNGGICRVQGLERKHIAGRDWRMLILEREEDRARVMVPEDKVGSIGLRKVASADDIRLLFDFFVSSSVDPELDWKVRHKENVGRLVAGGLLDTAQVLKGLHALSRIRPLPQRERGMYDSARHQLVREIAAALSVPPAVAENNIDYALTPPPGSGRTAPKDAPIDLKALRKVLGGRKISVGGAELDLEEGGGAGESESDDGEDLFGDLGRGEAEGDGYEETAVAGNEDTEEPAEKAPAKAAKDSPSRRQPIPAKPAAAKPAKVSAAKATKVTKAPAAEKVPAAKSEKAATKAPALKGEKTAPKAPAKAKPASKTATASKKPAGAKPAAKSAAKSAGKSAAKSAAPAKAATAKGKKR